MLVGDDGREYADLVVGTYHVKFSYTERGETVTVTPAVSVTVIADELTGLEVVLDDAPVYDTAALEDLRAHLTVTGKHTVGDDTEVTGYTLTCVSAGGWKNEPGEYTVRVTYGQLSQEVQVTVLANRAERLEVTFGQEKPVYTSTEKSDIADYGTLAVTVFYSDGSEKVLSYDASGMSGYTIEEGTFADGDTVAIYYKETDKAGSVASVSAEVRVVVDDVRPSHISYEVKEGEHIFTTDTTPTAIQDKLTVTLHYNDGTSESVEHFTVESVSLSSGGELTFVVAAEKDGETFRTEGTVTPEEVAPESLEVALRAGAGTIYVTEDAESIKAYLTVKVLYNNGTEKELAPSDYAAAISGGELQPGSNTLVITYEGEGASLSRTFAVDAEAVYFERIEVEVKAEYGSGTQIRDGVLFTSDDAESVKAYITVTGYWNDETQTEIPVYSYTVTGSFAAGMQTFTVHYTDDSDRATHTATFTANVTEVALESITAEFRQGGNTIYANTSPDDVRSMLRVVAHYNDGTSRVISTGYTVQVNGGAGFAEDGENVITVTYTDNEVTKEATASGSVVVTKKALAGVRAESVQGSGVLYASADWNRVSGYLAVYAVYNDGSETRLSYDASGESGYTLTGNLHESETVTVLYKQYNAQATLNVIPVEVVSIDEVTVEGGATFYTNTSLETVKNYLTVKVAYNDGNSGTLAPSEYELTGEMTAGEAELTVSVNGQSQTVQVTVTDDAITGIASVSASQGGAVIYSDATAEELKAYLTVTVNLNNGGTKALSAEDYALEFTDGGIAGETYLIRIEGTNFLYEWENTLSITQVAPTELDVTFEQGDLVVLSNTPLRTLADYLTVRVKYNNSEDWTELSYGGADGYTLSGSFGTAEADVQITVKYSYNGAEVTDTITVHVTATSATGIEAELSAEVPVIYATAAHASDAELKALVEGCLTVRLVYNNGAVQNLSAASYTLSVDGEWAAGEVTVKVSYNTFETTFTLNVLEAEVTNIAAEWNETAVYTNDTLDEVKSALTVTAYYNDGSSRDLESGEYTLRESAGSLALGGTVTFMVQYSEGGALRTYNVTVTVTVNVPTAVNAEAKGGVTLYPTSSAEAVKNALTVTVTYTDGSQKEVTNFELGEYTLAAGSVSIPVSYTERGERVETSVQVTVSEVTVGNISVSWKSGSQPAVYTSASLDSLKALITVTGTGTDGSTNMGEIADYTLSVQTGTWGQEGEVTVLVTYAENVTATFTVTLTAYELATDGVEFNQDFVIYEGYTFDDVKAQIEENLSVVLTWTDGANHYAEHEYGIVSVTGEDGGETVIHDFAQDLAASGLVQLVARFNNGQEISVTLTDGMISLPADGLKEGQNNTVTVTYAYGDVSKTATIEVYVTAKALEGITAEWTGEGTVYTSTQIESLKAHIMVTLVYNDGTTEDAQDFEITTTRLTAGTNRIDVQYAPEEGEALTASFGLDVTEVKVSGITAVWTNGEQPEVYDTTDLKTLLTVTAANNDGSPAGTLASTAYRVEGTLTAGQECTVRIVYNADESIYFELSVQVEETLVTEITASYNENVGGYVFTSTSFEEWAQGNGFTVTATYNNGTSRNLAKGEYTLAFTSGNAFTEGTTGVTATYAGEDYAGAAAPSAAFDVTVRAIEVSSAEVTFNGVKVTSADSLETLKDKFTAALSAQVSFNNGQQYAFTITAEYSDWQVSDGRWTAKAAWTIRGNGFADYAGESTLEIGGDVTYTITYEGVSEGELASLTQEYTVSDADLELTAFSREGYTFGGWSGTGVSGNVFDTATAQDVTIAASWTIVAPEISGLENVTATYTPEGTTLTAGVEETDGLMYAYQWYKGVEPLDGQTGISLTLKGVAASGTYKLVVTVSGDDADNVTAEKEVTVTINKAAASVPVAPKVTGELTYGQALSALTLTENWAWVNGDTVPAVSDSGTTGYGVRIAVDDENYDWSGTDGYADGYYTATVTVTVNAKEITVTITPNGGTYNDVTGATAALDPDALVGEDDLTVTLTYTSTGGYNSTDVPTDAGTYTVTASISDGNYKLTGMVTAEFVIEKASVIRPTEDAEGFVYTGEQRTYMPEGFDEEKMNISGNVQTDANEDGYTVTVSLKDADNYKWATGDTSADIEFEFVIRKAAPDYEKPENLTATYGDVLASVDLPAGWSWESEEDTLVGNAGSNTFTAAFTPDDTANYNIVTGVELTVQVAKATPNVTATVNTDGTVYTSDSLYEIEITADAGGVAGEIVWNEGQALTAGENSYTWTFTPTDTDNYNTVTGSSKIAVSAMEETGITVTKQPTKTDYTALESFAADGMEVTLYYADGASKVISDYTLSIAGQDDMVLRYGTDGSVTVKVTYNGHTAEVQVTVEKIVVEVPSAVTGLVYNGSVQVGVAENDAYTVTGGSATSAGNYEATVTLKDGENYAWSEEFDGTISWSIAKAKYDMSGVAFEDKIVSYSGEAQTIAVSGTLPAGVTVTYVYTKDGKAVDSAAEAGEYTVTAVFAGDAANYEPIPSMTATLTVEASGTGITGGEIAGLAVGGAACVGLGIVLVVLRRKTRRLGR